jgi:hypothetical protein
MFGLTVSLMESQCATVIFAKSYTSELQQNRSATVISSSSPPTQTCTWKVFFGLVNIEEWCFPFQQMSAVLLNDTMALPFWLMTLMMQHF